MLIFIRLNLCLIISILFTVTATARTYEREYHYILAPNKALIDTTKHIDVISLKDQKVDVSQKSKYGYSSLQQVLKGEVGVYVSEATSEPGIPLQMFIRGVNSPIINSRDYYNQQPLIVLDGIPLIGEHPFSYDIQSYDIERIGPENNLLMNLNLDNIESIQVLKDIVDLSFYGPMGANGVIDIKTRANVNNNVRRININSYAGMSLRPQVTTINGDFENKFRKQFYDKYTANGKYNNDDIFPVYLSDSLNSQYFGASDWSDSYYRNGLLYNANVNLSGGGKRANFQFAIGGAKNEGIADLTSLSKYHSMFSLSLAPLKWLNFDIYINASRYDRARNRNLRNRIGLMSYFPDLGTPLSPNRAIYDAYLTELDKSIDDNFTNIVDGYLGLKIDLKKFTYTSRFSVDFNEGYRDIFYPRTVMEGNSFASNYYGYNQRLLIKNALYYTDKLNDNWGIRFDLGNDLQWDLSKYNYAYAYKGINDYIKLNLLHSDPTTTNYLTSSSFPRELMYKFIDRTRHNLVSTYLSASIFDTDKFTGNLVIRSDGSSNAQPTARWFISTAGSLKYNVLKNSESLLQKLDFKIGAGRLGLINQFDNYSQGPNYTAQVGYTGNQILGSYNGIAPLTRPYSNGWIGYDLPWAYIDQFDLNADLSLKPLQSNISISYYLRDTKNQIIGVPGGNEYGYSIELMSGMDVRNQGIELFLNTSPIRKKDFKYDLSLGLNYNHNKLLALPNNFNSVVIGERKLEVGKSIHQFWIYDNVGIYASDSEVPVANGEVMKFKGIDMKGGDPKWVDKNGDNNIDNDDRVLKGNIFPALVGNFNNHFQYKNWEMNLNFYYNLGRNIINREMSNRFNFINNEGVKDLNAIKEISFWEKRGDYSMYEIYNPWSSVNAYQENQSIFVENGSFFKLREVSLSYDLAQINYFKTKKINKMTVFLTASNVWTLSKYSGRDPELVDFSGYDGGYSLVFPRTFTVGFKMGL